MNIPGLGEVVKDESLGWYCSQPIALPIFDGQRCRICVDGYDDDMEPQAFHSAIANFLSSPSSTLIDATPYVFEYYRYIGLDADDEDDALSIESPENVWDHVRVGDEVMVYRRAYGDKGVYVSVECECDWEQEHGLEIVLKDGLRITKVGPYNGQATHSDAYADARLENVVYVRPDQLKLKTAHKPA